MFATEKEKEVSKINGVGVVPPMSVSDQRIEYRPFASAMKITIDGEEFNIRPPSMHVSNTIKQFKLDYIKKMSRQRDTSVEIGKRLDAELKRLRESTEQKKEENREAEDLENVEAMVNVYDELQNELFKIQDLSDREMLRLVQLIILDGQDKYKNWRDEYESFPPDSILEKAIPYQRLYRHADVAELQVLLDIYNQMNKPEYARKNFQALSPMV